jgi:hypothetical protein
MARGQFFPQQGKIFLYFHIKNNKKPVNASFLFGIEFALGFGSQKELLPGGLK